MFHHHRPIIVGKKMAIPIHIVSLFLFLGLFVTETFSSVPSDPLDRPKSYIIHISKSDKPSAFAFHQHWYSSILQSLSTSSPNATKILYTYERAVNGFSALLTTSQAAEVRNVPGVLSVLPDELLEIQTTRTPYFLGLRQGSGLWPQTNYGENIIIGVIDSGIWPELSSFSDEGLSPVPTHWKGKCETGPDFPASSCNRKIIGARAYRRGHQAVTGKPLDEAKESKSPRDTSGHGTHTASTAAGSAVLNASFYGYGRGTARGVAGKARIAVYKVCWSPGGCSQADILEAMDDAISDGVDVISFSIGQKRGLPREYYQDNIAIGAFGAVQHGILFSCSAGNNGPGPYTTRNIAPWMLSVGASTIDREFRADVVLGNGNVFTGKSLYAGDPLVNSTPLVYGGDSGDSQCRSGKLIPSKVTGKIVICESGGNAVEKGIAVKSSGGVGMIVVNSATRGGGFAAYPYLLPATMVSHADGNKIKAYVKSVPSPRATIVFKGKVIETSPPAPRIASFSSRGPNNLTAEILKPDVIAPGVDILAGWTGATSPSKLDADPRRVKFNVISGTSMACPHVTGLAALLRKAHPMWTPAAIKSALMTTAYNKDNLGLNIKDSATGKSSTPFAHGSGHVDAFKALDPGLVYDMGEHEYLAFLCAIGYNEKQIAVFLRWSGKVDCKNQSLSSPGDLNYPSFSVVFRSNRKVVNYKRVVTNVGSSVDSIYKVKIVAPRGVKVSVSPSELVFKKEKRSLSYTISFTSTVVDHELGEFGVSSSQAFGSIEWSDGTHLVRSPIAVV